MNGYTMYLHQAINQEDSADFIEAVVKEINSHVDNKHWELVPIEDLPEEEDPLPSVWSVLRKRNLVTNKITNYKARMNVHKKTLGVNYFNTYTLLVTWFAIQLLIIIAMVLLWQLHQVYLSWHTPKIPSNATYIWRYLTA